MKKNKILIKILIIFMTLVSSIKAQKTILLENPDITYNIGSDVEILIDSTGLMSLDDIISLENSKKFKPNLSSNFHYSQSVYWVRLKVSNISKHKDWLLCNLNNNPNLINFYYPVKNKTYKSVKTGILKSFDTRDIDYRKFVFHLNIIQGKEYIYYLRVDSRTIFPLDITIWSDKTFDNNIRLDYVLLGIFYGILLFILSYNVLLLFVHKANEHIYYVLFLISCILLFLSIDGLLQINISSYFIKGRILPLIPTLCFIFFVVFSAFLLNVRETLPKIYISLIWILIIYCLFFILLLFINHYLIYIGLFFFFAITLIFLIIISIISNFSENYSIQYYMISLVGFILGILIFGLQQMDFIPQNIITNNFHKFGFIWLTLFISIAYADQLKLGVKNVNKDYRDLRKKHNKLKAIVKLHSSELVKAQTAAQIANNTKSEFLANISHELRTPLNAIIGYAELLASEVSGDKQNHYVDSIKISGKNLLTIINDILDLSKIEAGQMELKYTQVNIHELCTEVQQIFDVKLKAKHLDLQIDVEPHLPDAIILDKIRIRQVLMNLVGNAIKFTKEGYIKLSIHKEYKDKEYSKLDLIITVEDTGVGIPENHLNKIFQSFEQEDGKAAIQFSGAGLGLTISKRMVEMMNGILSVNSVMGEGSVFKIILYDVAISSKKVIHEREKKYDINNISFNNASILVVDDIESNREVLHELLEKMHAKVSLAENGQEAIVVAEMNQPDVILMDIIMPVMDGLESTLYLKQNKLTKEIPIIALTASMEEDTPGNLIKQGFNGFLGKPLNVQNLIEELTRFIKLIDLSKVDIQDQETDNMLQKENKQSTNLMDIINNEIIPAISLLQNTDKMDEVIQFAYKLKNTGIKVSIPFFSASAENLLEAAQEYDVVTIKKIIDDLSEKIKTLLL